MASTAWVNGRYSHFATRDKYFVTPDISAPTFRKLGLGYRDVVLDQTAYDSMDSEQLEISTLASADVSTRPCWVYDCGRVEDNPILPALLHADVWVRGS